ncbi:MAG: anthranilate synthase component I family protein [Acidimicrobiia bacterium]|nr:anthranilate synthase component I family protein [Acidimicrobiia bacterium]
MRGGARLGNRSSGEVLAALPDEIAATVVRDGPAVVIACGTEEVIESNGTAVFAALDALSSGWWAGFISYELGRAVERVERRVRRAANLPDARFMRFSARVRLQPGHDPIFEGRGDALRRLVDAVDNPEPVPAPEGIDRWTSSLNHDEYEQGVRTIVELIESGHCYQANLTRRLTGQPVDAIRLWSAVDAGNPAPHATFFRFDDLAIVSASPELFLHLDGGRVFTRPIKGTNKNALDLMASAKDYAENVMIVDLSRNDLGRIAVPGSIQVPGLCELETHPGLVHLVSTVSAEMRDGVGLGGLLRATFPPASVTGAPKPRVLQVIEDLEPVTRDIYCGALGWIDTDQARADLSVAIRTFAIDEETRFGVGSGITADSNPTAEWEETELKASRLLALAGTTSARVQVGAGLR